MASRSRECGRNSSVLTQLQVLLLVYGYSARIRRGKSHDASVSTLQSGSGAFLQNGCEPLRAGSSRTNRGGLKDRRSREGKARPVFPKSLGVEIGEGVSFLTKR